MKDVRRLICPHPGKSQGRFEGKTRFNFASTDDLAAGSSGSPVVNRKGEFVGMVFDGNAVLSWDFEYDDHQGRAVSVDSRRSLKF